MKFDAILEQNDRVDQSVLVSNKIWAGMGLIFKVSHCKSF